MTAWRVARPLKYGVALVFMIGFAAFLWSARHDLLRAMQVIRPGQVATIAGLLLVQWVLRAWRDRILFTLAGYPLPVISLLWLNLVQVALNYLPFKAGTVSSAGLLVARYGVPLERFAVLVSRQFLLGVLASCTLGAAAVWFSSAGTGVLRPLMFVALLGLAIAACGLLVWDGSIRALAGLALRGHNESGVSHREWLGSPRKSAGIVGLTLAVSLVSAMRMLVVFAVVSVHVGIADALVISASLMLSPLVSITPGGIGITESLVGVTAELLNKTGRLGVVAATLDRVLVLTFAVVLAIALTPWALYRARYR